jgi:hypothetical protein
MLSVANRRIDQSDISMLLCIVLRQVFNRHMTKGPMVSHCRRAAFSTVPGFGRALSKRRSGYAASPGLTLQDVVDIRITFCKRNDLNWSFGRAKKQIADGLRYISTQTCQREEGGGSALIPPLNYVDRAGIRIRAIR